MVLPIRSVILGVAKTFYILMQYLGEEPNQQIIVCGVKVHMLEEVNMAFILIKTLEILNYLFYVLCYNIMTYIFEYDGK